METNANAGAGAVKSATMVGVGVPAWVVPAMERLMEEEMAAYHATEEGEQYPITEARVWSAGWYDYMHTDEAGRRWKRRRLEVWFFFSSEEGTRVHGAGGQWVKVHPGGEEEAIRGSVRSGLEQAGGSNERWFMGFMAEQARRARAQCPGMEAEIYQIAGELVEYQE